MFALYYTVLHNYCQDHQFPSPPPAMNEVVAEWTSAFQPAQSEAEGLYTMASGKAVRMPMSGPDPSASQPAAPRPTGLRRITTWGSSKEKPQQEAEAPPPRTQRIGSTTSLASSERSAQLSRQSSRSNIGMPTDFTTATQSTTPGGLGRLTPGYTPSREKGDYFGHQSQQQQNGSAATTPMSSASYASSAIAKKKPPPPPPPKKRIQAPVAEYVVAVHTYPGGQQGDLAFNEGDRIKIVKKTATMDDWWEGELNGLRGSFPANYCKMA